MVDLTPVFAAVLALCGALIVCFVVPLIKRKLTDAQFEELHMWVGVACDAAEQIFKGSKLGEKKKEWAMAFLAERGYTADLDALDALVEAYVQNHF